MHRSIRALVGLITFLGGVAQLRAEICPVPGLARVVNQNVEGTGFVVQGGDHSWLLSAAHVVAKGGEWSASVLSTTGELVAIKTLSLQKHDAFNDIALIEVSPSTQAFAQLVKGHLILSEVATQAIRRGCAGDFASALVVAAHTLKGLAPRYESLAINAISWTLFRDNLISPLRIRPGFSGAPLVIESSMASKLEVAGLALSTYRSYPRSFFAPPSQLSALISSEPSSQVVLHWEHLGSLSYRVFNDGSREIVPLSVASGNGISADGGNGISADGSRSASRVFKSAAELGLKPGLVYKGKPTIAFRLRPLRKSRNDRLLYLYADWESLRIVYSEELRSRYQIESVSPSENLAAIFAERLGAREKSFHVDLYPSSMLTSIFDTGMMYSGRIEVSPNRIALTLELLGEGDKIHVEVTRNKNKEWDLEPILNVQSQLGRRFEVDLRGLLFGNVTDVLVQHEFVESFKPIDVLSSFYPNVYYLRIAGPNDGTPRILPFDLRYKGYLVNGR